MFFFKKADLARSVILLFGGISFLIMLLKEELLRWAYKSRFGQLQLKKRVMLLGSREDTERMRSELSEKGDDNFEVVAELDLNEGSVSHLIHLLHERSVNSVILNGKHTYFGQIEKAIQACEIEGVEAWLIADFFRPRYPGPASTISTAVRCWFFAPRRSLLARGRQAVARFLWRVLPPDPGFPGAPVGSS